VLVEVSEPNSGDLGITSGRSLHFSPSGFTTRLGQALAPSFAPAKHLRRRKLSAIVPRMLPNAWCPPGFSFILGSTRTLPSPVHPPYLVVYISYALWRSDKYLERLLPHHM
jgi:hypothetical protein